MLLHIKNFLLLSYSLLKLKLTPFYIFWRQEYFAYKTKKLEWNHAWSLTYRLFCVCLYPLYKSIIILVYTAITDFRLPRSYYYYKSNTSKFIVDIIRPLYIKIAVRYTNFADKSSKYWYSFFGYVCIGTLIGLTISLIFSC